jgi:transcriptional regulator with XRE-family HTH domain
MDKPINKEIGERLLQYINRYFTSQTEFAVKAEMAGNTINGYIRGRRGISRKIADKMEKTTGIRADWLLYGKEPISSTDGIPDQEHKSEYIDEHKRTKISRGFAHRILLSGRNSREFFRDNGECNVADIVFDSIDKPFIVDISSDRFAGKYGIQRDSVLILSPNYKPNDTVLVAIRDIAYMCVFDGDKFIDTADNISVWYSTFEGLQVIGRIYSKVEFM